MPKEDGTIAIRYSIVVPFYNEEQNVRHLYAQLRAVMDRVGHPYEFVFVDDGSTDATFRLMDELFRTDPHVRLIRLRRNFGQTAGLAAGFDHAVGDIVIAMDGDLQHDPEDIPVLLMKIDEGYDIVSGWRQARVDDFLTRRLPSKVANWLMAKLSGLPLHDFGTTFKAYRREVLKEVKLYGELHRFIPALANRYGATIAEVPIRNISRKHGRSNYGLSRTLRVMLDLITVKFLMDYATKPLQFFGLFGLSSLAIGGALSFFLLVKKIGYGTHILVEHGPLFLLAILLIIVGIQFVSIGLLGEMLSRTYFESQGKAIYTVREVRSHGRTAETYGKSI